MSTIRNKELSLYVRPPTYKSIKNKKLQSITMVTDKGVDRESARARGNIIGTAFYRFCSTSNYVVLLLVIHVSCITISNNVGGGEGGGGGFTLILLSNLIWI